MTDRLGVWSRSIGLRRNASRSTRLRRELTTVRAEWCQVSSRLVRICGRCRRFAAVPPDRTRHPYPEGRARGSSRRGSAVTDRTAVDEGGELEYDVSIIEEAGESADELTAKAGE